ncbi:MAG TPA: hypothetical protein VF230_16135 [Acidimicrobiales bacterium]
MKRMLIVAAVSLLAAALLSYSPASAHFADVCIGQGDAVTDNPVYYPKVLDDSTDPPTVVDGPSASGAATFNFSTGGCLTAFVPDAPWVHSGSVEAEFASGLLTDPDPPFGNYCGHSEGIVKIPDHPASWISVASMLVIIPDAAPGGAAGVVNAVPNLLEDQSCLEGATEFLVTGALVLF